MLKNVVIFTFLILLSVAVGTLFYFHFNKSSKIAFVDAAKLVDGYQGMKDASDVFEKRAVELRNHLDTLQMELETLTREYQQTSSSLTQKDRQLKEQAINVKQGQYVSYEQAVTKELQQQDQKLTQNVLSQVNEYVKIFGEKNGYTIIMAATQSGNIIYGQPQVDITQEILEGLNKNYRP